MSQLAISMARQSRQAALRNTPRHPLSDHTLDFSEATAGQWDVTGFGLLEYDVPVWHGTYCDRLESYSACYPQIWRDEAFILFYDLCPRPRAALGRWHTCGS